MEIINKIQHFIISNPEWCAIFISTLVLELWIGKSKKVSSNSTLELVFNIIISIFRRRKK